MSFFGNTKFRKRVNLAPGVSANFGKTGGSVSVGPRGCKTTFGKDGVRTTVGIPGTGLSTSTYKPNQSKRKNSPAMSDGQSRTIPIRSRRFNMAWGFTCLVLSLVIIISSFSYPHIMEVGRWIISIIGGGFFLIGSILFFTAKSKEDYREEINELDDRLNDLEENLNELKESAQSQEITQLSTNDIDNLLQRFYDKVQEYYGVKISSIRDKDNIQFKEKANIIWDELQIQMTEIDNVVQFMNTRQSEYYNAIKPK